MADSFFTEAAGPAAALALRALEGLADTTVDQGSRLALLGGIFALLALAVKGRGALAAARDSAQETRLNLLWYAADAVFILPVMAAVAGVIALTVDHCGLAIVAESFWQGLPFWAVLLAGVALSDFTGYWRHRLMHSAALWPAHAIHHSDRAMTWLALARMHPVNRLVTTACNMAVLSLFGFPLWVVIVNGWIRSWYGHFIHADLPWTYGRTWGRVFVSPVLHRWHHTRDETAAGRNFATVFAFYDVLFGTWHCPSARVGALGIDEPGFPDRWAGQLLWPVICWRRGLRFRMPPRLRRNAA